MELLMVVMALSVQLVRIALQRRAPQGVHKSKPACADCTFAHLQVDAKGKTAIFCTFGGGVRPVREEVVFCTDFVNRYAPVRKTSIGFRAMDEAA